MSTSLQALNEGLQLRGGCVDGFEEEKTQQCCALR